MILLEVVMSLLTLVSVWCLTHKYTMMGVSLGIVMQIGWIIMWFYTGQVGIMVLDVGLIIIYAHKIKSVITRKG